MHPPRRANSSLRAGFCLWYTESHETGMGDVIAIESSFTHEINKFGMSMLKLVASSRQILLYSFLASKFVLEWRAYASSFTKQPQQLLLRGYGMLCTNMIISNHPRT